MNYISTPLSLQAVAFTTSYPTQALTRSTFGFHASEPLLRHVPPCCLQSYLHASHHLLKLCLLLIQHSEWGPWLSVCWQLWHLPLAAACEWAAQPVCELCPVHLELQQDQRPAVSLCGSLQVISKRPCLNAVKHGSRYLWLPVALNLPAAYPVA